MAAQIQVTETIHQGEQTARCPAKWPALFNTCDKQPFCTECCQDADPCITFGLNSWSTRQVSKANVINNL